MGDSHQNILVTVTTTAATDVALQGVAVETTEA
jgi:hypothetical protein